MFELPQFLSDLPTAAALEDWEAMNDGERLRWLKAHQPELSLTRDQYLELARTPFWAAYGPEDGLPNEIFNQQGFLLPKYRPGGGLYQDFNRWRRWYRRITWRERLLYRRVEGFYSRYRVFILAAWYLAGLIVGTRAAPSLQQYLPKIPVDVVKWGMIFLFWLGSPLLVRAVATVVSMCIARDVARSLQSPPASAS